MADTNKVLTIFEVRDHLATALDKNNKKFDQLTDANNRFDDSLDKSMRRGSANVDKLDKGFGKFAGTLRAIGTLTLAAGAAIGTLLVKGVQNAKEYNAEFRQLENLNLDKSPAEIQKLNKNVLDAAFNAGRLPAEMSKAFFDIQSGTGKFGAEVEAIAKKTSDFSRGFKVDFTTAVEGAVKGIKNFNLEAKDMDRFFASMQKTVQVGIVTFEQLAQVQTDYAGAANTAGQSVDSANKLFAVFTAKAKSAEEAATLTKSAFQDLLKPSTLKAFDKLGIEVFDRQTGKVKQIDEIVGDLNKKFERFRGNDKAISSLVNEFGGNEGLVALIGEAAKNGDQMLRTFKDFDNVDFNLEKALRNSKLDLDEMTKIVGNRLNVVFTELGQILIPDIVEGLSYVNTDVLPRLREKLPDIKFQFMQISDTVGNIASGLQNTISGIGSLLEKGRSLDDRFSPLKIFGNRRRLRRQGYEEDIIDSLSNRAQGVLARETAQFDNMQKAFGKEEALSRMLTSLKNADASPQLITMLESRLARERALNFTGSGEAEAQSPMKTVSTKVKPIDSEIQKVLGGASDRTRRGLEGVSTGGNQVRNVTVNIQKMVGIENLVTTVVEQARGALEEAMREMLIKSIRDAEVGISNAM